MKNIHIIPTGKEPVKGDLLLRHLWKGEANECISWWRYNDTTMYGDTLVYTTLNGSFMDVPSSFKVQNIYITSDEEIKIGVDQWYLDKFLNKPMNSSGAQYGQKQNVIILTTDQELIKDGVQSIDDEFLEWFVKNPSCEEVEVKGYMKKIGTETDDNGWREMDVLKQMYDIIIPQEEPKQETLEEANERLFGKHFNGMHYDDIDDKYIIRYGIALAKWQQEQDKNKYSEEEVLRIISSCKEYLSFGDEFNEKEWFKQFKKK